MRTRRTEKRETRRVCHEIPHEILIILVRLTKRDVKSPVVFTATVAVTPPAAKCAVRKMELHA